MFPQAKRWSATACTAKSVKEFFTTTATRITNWDALLTSAPLHRSHCCPLLVPADKEIEEKRKTAQSSRHSTISLKLSVLFKHFSQFSRLSRMFPNPRLPLRLLNEEIMLLLFCLSTSFAHILFKFKPWFPRGVRIEEVFSNWQLNLQQMWKSETSEEGGMGGAVCG